MLRFDILKNQIGKYVNRSNRTKKAIKNIALSFVAKGISIICSLLIVPLTINYVNPTRYGIWLTLSSIIGWIGFFDLGLGNGFRNRFAEAIAKEEYLLARQYLSTAYAAIGMIALILLIVVQIGNIFINWAEVLRVDAMYAQELRVIFSILTIFFCLSMVVNIAATMLTADQKPGWPSAINGIGQLCSLFVIFVLTKVSHGSLVNLATYYAGVPCIVMILASYIIFHTKRYRELSPNIKYVRLNLVKNILYLGFRFFIIYLCLILIFQIMNIIISREIGPFAVTQYNIVYRYFNVLYMGMAIIVTPFWSAFTDAYVKKDFVWMKTVIKNLEKLFIICFAVGIIMTLLSSYIYKFWIGDTVQIPFGLTMSVLIYILCTIIGNIYMYMINGIGTIRIQTIVYVLFAIVFAPLFSYFCRNWGLNYAILLPAMVYFIQALLAKIQLMKIISGKAVGLWLK